VVVLGVVACVCLGFSAMAWKNGGVQGSMAKPAGRISTKISAAKAFASAAKAEGTVATRASKSDKLGGDSPVVSRRDVAVGVPVGAGLAAVAGKAKAEEGSGGVFNVEFEVQLTADKTDKFVIEVHPEWAPLGAEQFKKLVTDGFYNDCRFFRVVEGFVVQWGINGDPDVNKKYKKPIQDDPVKTSNKRGTLTFATSGKNSRTTQLFINFGDNTFLDRLGFSPIGKVAGDGMKVVDSIYDRYGEGAPNGSGPDQGRIQRSGNAYLEKNYPKLSYIKTAKVA